MHRTRDTNTTTKANVLTKLKPPRSQTLHTRNMQIKFCCLFLFFQSGTWFFRKQWFAPCQRLQIRNPELWRSRSGEELESSKVVGGCTTQYTGQSTWPFAVITYCKNWLPMANECTKNHFGMTWCNKRQPRTAYSIVPKKSWHRSRNGTGCGRPSKGCQSEIRHWIRKHHPCLDKQVNGWCLLDVMCALVITIYATFMSCCHRRWDTRIKYCIVGAEICTTTPTVKIR